MLEDVMLKSQYDYRFNVLTVWFEKNGDRSQVYHIRMSDLLRQMPVYEIEAALNRALKPYQPEQDIEEARRQVIKDAELTGKTVLDIGGYDGWAAKLALECGAQRAICLDNHQYDHYGWEDKKHEGVEYVQGDFMDLRHEEATPLQNHGTCLSGGEPERLVLSTNQPTGAQHFTWKAFPVPDVIVFFNVLYHVKNMWSSLEHLRKLIKPGGEMLLCTLFRWHEGPWVYLYDEYTCNPSDSSVFWGPSLDALELLLKCTGWEAKQVAAANDRCVYRCKATLEPQYRESRY